MTSLDAYLRGPVIAPTGAELTLVPRGPGYLLTITRPEGDWPHYYDTVIPRLGWYLRSILNDIDERWHWAFGRRDTWATIPVPRRIAAQVIDAVLEADAGHPFTAARLGRMAENCVEECNRVRRSILGGLVEQAIDDFLVAAATPVLQPAGAIGGAPREPLARIRLGPADRPTS